MMDQTHVMYYYWQQPMANTYVESLRLLHGYSCYTQDAIRH